MDKNKLEKYIKILQAVSGNVREVVEKADKDVMNLDWAKPAPKRDLVEIYKVNGILLNVVIELLQKLNTNKDENAL